MNEREFNQLLKSVSRSFYLTLKFLPQVFKQPTSIAYLLARASDTIADYRLAPPQSRIEWLEGFLHAINSENSSLPASPKWLDQLEHQGEKKLLTRLNSVMAVTRELPESILMDIKEVLNTIIRGQIADIEYFEVNSSEAIRSFNTDSQLDDYTYSVAGCVGVFWTQVGLKTQANYSRLSSDKLMELGAAYGKGLQLVNILRDVQSDELIGRCYIPCSDLETESNEASLLESRAEMIKLAKEHLNAGLEYSTSLVDWRTRFATILPAKLAFKTLDKIEKASSLDWKKPVKISRFEVYKTLLNSLI